MSGRWWDRGTVRHCEMSMGFWEMAQFSNSIPFVYHNIRGHFYLRIPSHGVSDRDLRCNSPYFAKLTPMNHVFPPTSASSAVRSWPDTGLCINRAHIEEG